MTLNNKHENNNKNIKHPISEVQQDERKNLRSNFL